MKSINWERNFNFTVNDYDVRNYKLAIIKLMGHKTNNVSFVITVK